ncbi:hypothetical protein C8T65DRAFT_580005 [Cerioporus squamosus]|nr:hypothetical protein C8T65DRAFT_580005 [Cerioporus squamosus]
MLSKRTLENTIVPIAIVVLALNAAFKLSAETVLKRADVHSLTAFWHVERKEVLLEMDSWTRYTLDSGAQWAPLFPEGGIVYLGPAHTPYTVSMMHQLRCLDVVRDQLTRPLRDRDAEPTRHCLNYLRQMVTCRGDLQIDPYQYAHKINAVHPHAIRRCKDWNAVYEQAWENQREYRAWAGGSGNGTVTSTVRLKEE